MSTQQAGLVAGNKQNEPGGATGKSRSTFPLSYSFFETERFAEYTPFYVQEGVDTDRLPLHSNHEVQTYTLKSPVLQSLAKKKDYFMVPMQAILPLNWDKFYTNPNIGEDVPVDSGCGVANFWSMMKDLHDRSWTKLITDFAAYAAGSSGAPSSSICLDELFHYLIFFEQIYSAGSLMETLGTSGHNWWKCNYYPPTMPNGILQVQSFDQIFDQVMSSIEGYLLAGGYLTFSFTTQSPTVTYLIVPSKENITDGYAQNGVPVTLREALELMRDDLTFTFSAPSQVASFDPVGRVYDYLKLLQPYLPASDAPYNLSRLWAYQLVCAHYYSNDHVDFIYSADLFRQYIRQLCTGSSSGSNQDLTPTFTVNGFTCHYDALSAYCFYSVWYRFGSNGIFSLNSTPYFTLAEIYAYFTALFSFKRSLRFMDYFTGSRSLPVAVGNTSVNVNAGKVDIIDLSRSSMMTKFLLAVNRSGRKFGAYMQELFGKTPAYDYHNPMYLAHTSDLVGAQETDNTGEAQVTDKIAVTSRFRASSSRYVFEFTPDRDCVVIGITYYDLPRVYTRATERQNFILDRFDMFNPYLQFIGDQPVWQAELGTTTPTYGDPNSDVPFAYQNRDMQWKQRFNQACGGFCVPSTGLDNWIFPADTLRRTLVHNISPSFIRSFNSEIDRFYQSLSGYSLGTYFHFIVRYDNRMDASRPMAYNPTINV